MDNAPNAPYVIAFAKAVRAYHRQVQALKQPGDSICVWSKDSEILALLRQRDRIQFFIDQSAQQPETAEIPSPLLVQLSQDDATLSRWAEQFTRIEPFSHWQKSLAPPKHHWWWHSPPEPAKPWTHWLLGGLTIALLTVCLALARDISTRFFTGAPGIWSSLGAIAPAALALFATGGALTKVGQQLIDSLLARQGRSPHHEPWIKFGLAAALTVMFFIGHFQGLPWAADQYFAVGQRQYFDEGKLTSAQGNFQRALQLHPDFPEANHNLALTYEDLRDFDSAKAEYVKALSAGYLKSVNNLARLQIAEDQKYESAAVLLLTALKDEGRDREDTELEYGLRKNLGWAWLEQNRLIKAQGELIKANRLEASLPEPRPDAYCLLAQVLEKQQNPAEAKPEWERCRQKITRPEDDIWAAIADEALSYSTLSNPTTFPANTSPSTEAE